MSDLHVSFFRGVVPPKVGDSEGGFRVLTGGSGPERQEPESHSHCLAPTSPTTHSKAHCEHRSLEILSRKNQIRMIANIIFLLPVLRLRRRGEYGIRNQLLFQDIKGQRM